MVYRKDFGHQFKAEVIDKTIDEKVGVGIGDTLTINVYQKSLGQSLQPCDTIQGVFRLKPIHGSVNLHSFDYERYAFAKGLKASGYMRALHHLKEYPGSDLLCLNRYRQAFSVWVKALLPERQAGFVLALTIGDKSSLQSKDKQFLSQFGLIHLFVISGLHLGLIALITFSLASILIKRTYSIFGLVSLESPIDKIDLGVD